MEEPTTLETQDTPPISPQEPAWVIPDAPPEPVEQGNHWLMPLLGILIVVSVILASVYSASHHSDGGPVTGGADVAPLIGRQAPDFKLAALDGRTVRLSSLQGKPVLINMWATWCAYCVEEMPALQEAYRRYRDKDLAILAINIDDGEDIKHIRRFASKLGLSFTILPQGEAVAIAYQVQPLPTSFFVDRQGVIREVAFGAMNHGMLEQKLAAIL